MRCSDWAELNTESREFRFVFKLNDSCRGFENLTRRSLSRPGFRIAFSLVIVVQMPSL